MMRREAGTVFVTLNTLDADLLLTLTRAPRVEHHETGIAQETFAYPEEKFQAMLLALGWATGEAHRSDNREKAHEWLRLANAINEGNPNWRPYAVPCA